MEVAEHGELRPRAGLGHPPVGVAVEKRLGACELGDVLRAREATVAELALRLDPAESPIDERAIGADLAGEGLRIAREVELERLEDPRPRRRWPADGRRARVGEAHRVSDAFVLAELGLIALRLERVDRLAIVPQSGALNESLADIFGSYVEAEIHPGSRFEHGDQSGPVLRELAHPKANWQPDHMTVMRYPNEEPTKDNDWAGAHTSDATSTPDRRVHERPSAFGLPFSTRRHARTARDVAAVWEALLGGEAILRGGHVLCDGRGSSDGRSGGRRAPGRAPCASSARAGKTSRSEAGAGPILRVRWRRAAEASASPGA